MSTSQSFHVALAQINPIIGDFEGNLTKHLECIKKAKASQARVVVFSELSLVGYIPRDILLEPHFLNRQNQYLKKLIESVDDIYVIIGAVTKNPSGVEKPFFNSALVIHKGKIVFQYDKKLLPTYDVFDERRYFERGDSDSIFEIDGYRIGLTICEDMWQHSHNVSLTCYNEDPIEELKKAKLDLVINISGSPYFSHKLNIRKKIIHNICQDLNCPMVFVNQVGANDAIIFDGYSLCCTKEGVAEIAKGFQEDVVCFDIFDLRSGSTRIDDSYDEIDALVMGIRDYVFKNGFQNVVLGLSGGIDSALVLALCVEALGSDHVKAIFMPSKHTRPLSYELASKLAVNFKVSLDIVPIDHIVESYIDKLDTSLSLSKGGIAIENIQSRIRGNIIMAYANRFKALMMGCSNKSELAVGYGTIYGDIAGALLPIGDLLKVDVYRLSRLISSNRIPEDVFTRAPSAELYLNQIDTDSLPPYEILDPILKLFIEQGKDKDAILQNHPEFSGHIDHILHLFKISEFKRYQAPMILKMTTRNFGTGWDFPLTRK
jgi:NAD+ synthase (glutamine-hydrolysing)